MKKIIQVLILAILVFTVAAAGCLSADADNKNATNDSSKIVSNSTNYTVDRSIVNDTVPH